MSDIKNNVIEQDVIDYLEDTLAATYTTIFISDDVRIKTNIVPEQAVDVNEELKNLEEIRGEY